MLTGDVVIGWNDETIDSPLSLISLVAMTEVGSTAELVIIRRGLRMTLKVGVGERPRESQ